MKISGLQKMTLLDYPGKVACTVFLQGCNFRCPFCHNSGLLGSGEAELMTMDEFIAFLEKRRGLLDGVCVSGGEPTLAPDLDVLLHRIKALDFGVKLDTNGSRPNVLRRLLDENLLDYVAMDIKNSPARYAETIGCKPDLAALEESVRLLAGSGLDYELRTTVVAELHDAASMEDMCAWLSKLCGGKIPRLFLQKFVDRDSVLLGGLHAHEDAQMEAFLSILLPCAECVKIRG